MPKDLKYLQGIDEYLSGELNQEDRNEFEQKLKEDLELQEELNITKLVIEGIKGYAFREMLQDFRKKLIDENGELKDNR
jgi:anti-sigma factor RsiW